MSVTLNSELLAVLRKRTKPQATLMVGHEMMVALLDRIEALESDIVEVTDAFNHGRPVNAERLTTQEGRALARGTMEAKLAIEAMRTS